MCTADKWPDLYKKIKTHLRRVVFGPLAREARFEDLVHDMAYKCILKFGRGLERIEEINCIDAYLCRMAKNVFYAAIEREKNRKHHETASVKARPDDYLWVQTRNEDSGEILEEEILSLANHATSEKQRQYVVHIAMGLTFADQIDRELMRRCLGMRTDEQFIRLRHNLKKACQRGGSAIRTVSHVGPLAACKCQLMRVAMTNLTEHFYENGPRQGRYAIIRELWWQRQARDLVRIWNSLDESSWWTIGFGLHWGKSHHELVRTDKDRYPFLFDPTLAGSNPAAFFRAAEKKYEDHQFKSRFGLPIFSRSGSDLPRILLRRSKAIGDTNNKPDEPLISKTNSAVKD